jgi:glycosyltransferase involved in cell wall biosynthesis
VDRHVSPRVAYWTSACEPDIEAIAQEVAQLRRRFPASVAWGLNRQRWAVLSWRRGFWLHPRLHLVFRAATRLLEPAFQLNHVYGSPGDWFYLHSVKRRPTLLTVAALSEPVQTTHLQRVDRFVVEYPRGVEYLRRFGVPESRIRLILPPVDLARFAQSDRPDDPFTVLFASSPSRADSLDARGVPAILDAAAMRPALRFRLLWRPWGDSLIRVRGWIAQRGLDNVEVLVGRFADMPRQYRAAHVTVAPFRGMTHYKPAPNSLVESLACGRPVLTTPEVGLAELIDEAGAGILCDAGGVALAEGLDRLRADWRPFSARARDLAERCFGLERFLDGYDRVYRELL